MNEKTIWFEVIAKFPGSIHKVGDYIEVFESSGMAYVISIYDCSDKVDLRDYPHLFRQVEPSQMKNNVVKMPDQTSGGI